MLKGVNLDLEGRHHSGIDGKISHVVGKVLDARNIARVFIRMLEDGAVAANTGPSTFQRQRRGYK